MKVSELSARSGVPLPTIKFYIREGLLPAGARTGKNQAEYSQEHLERLSLIRALRDEAGLSVAAIGRSLAAADRAEPEHFLEAAIDAIERPAGAAVDVRTADFRKAKEAVLSVARSRGWDVEDAAAAVHDAARALAVILRSFHPDATSFLEPYADAVWSIASHEIQEGWRPDAAPNAALRFAVLGTVLFEPFILALRRMAHVARTRQVTGVTKKAGPAKSRRKA
jgi:DNA-binding transcriptional MerR regulator